MTSVFCKIQNNSVWNVNIGFSNGCGCTGTKAILRQTVDEVLGRNQCLAVHVVVTHKFHLETMFPYVLAKASVEWT